MEDREPDAENFDYCEGPIPPVGTRITMIVKPHDLDRILMRSDTCSLTVPELALEVPPGTGKYAAIREHLQEIRDKVESSSIVASASISAFIADIEEAVSGKLREGFRMQLDDPASHSFIRYDADYPAPPPKLKVVKYTRSPEEDAELGVFPETGDSSQQQDEEDTAETRAQKIASIVQMIREAKNIVGLTGAGISTESGIPAFRSDEAGEKVWDEDEDGETKDKYAHWSAFISDESSRLRYWITHKWLAGMIAKASPNPAHELFVKLNELGKLSVLLTQNIDSLHQRAGLPSEKIYELHGHVRTIKCTKCPTVLPDSALPDLDRTSPSPKCPNCGELLRSCTVMFGESLDSDLLEKARVAVTSCDLFLVLGTSLVVAPVNKLPGEAHHSGAKTVLINLSDTPMDYAFSTRIRDKCGAVAKEIMQKLSESDR